VRRDAPYACPVTFWATAELLVPNPYLHGLSEVDGTAIVVDQDIGGGRRCGASTAPAPDTVASASAPVVTKLLIDFLIKIISLLLFSFKSV
jgi:hypothetical protein